MIHLSYFINISIASFLPILYTIRQEGFIMEQLYVLGTGNATSVEAYNTCFVIKNGDRLFLTDTGGGNGLLMRLRTMGLELKDIHHVFLSHAHMDHCLGALWMIRVLTVPMAKGDYTQPLYFYGHQEVLDIVDQMCRMMLRPKFYAMIGKYIFFVPVKPQETRSIEGWNVTFFDIGSKKTLQYGYRLTLDSGKTLVFAGDEPLRPSTQVEGRNADWLLREVLCCHAEECKFHAYEKKHATVKEACEESVEMSVNNVVLWHLEDKTDKSIRKEKYLAEAAHWLEGKALPNVFIPDDGDIIEL